MSFHSIVNTYNQFEAWSDDNPLKSDFALGLFIFVVYTPVFYIEGSTVAFSLSVGAILSTLFVVVSSLVRRLIH